MPKDIIQLDLNNIPEMEQVIRAINPIQTFFQDFFFDEQYPVNADELYIQIEDEEGEIASPFVMEMADGVPLTHTGYSTETIEPPMIAANMVITGQDLKKKQIGEALFANIADPTTRADAMRANDYARIKRANKRRIEAMCAQVIFDNALTIEEYIDDMGKVHDPRYVCYFDEDENQSVYEISKDWSMDRESGKQIYEDIHKMLLIQDDKNLPADILVVAPDVLPILLHNEYFLELQDNRRLDVITWKPEWQRQGVTYFGRLNVYGKFIDIYSYNGFYRDPITKKKFKYVPDGFIVLGSFHSGRIPFGRVMMREDNDWVMYPGIDVPKYEVSKKGLGSERLTLFSRPLPYPKRKNSFLVAKVLGN